MKKLLILLGFLASTQWAMAQDNAEKNLVKSFDTHGATSIAFECKQKDIKSKHWDGGLVRVELFVKANMPEQVLEQLVKAGRYTLEGKVNENGEFVIIAPNIEKHVSVKGKDLEEEIVLNVQTPGIYYLAEGKRLQKDNSGTAFRSMSEAEKEKFLKIDHKVETAVKFKSTLKKQPSKKELAEIIKSHILIDGNPLIIE